jgi:hypothetical protein
MAATLISLRARIRAALLDSSSPGQVWDDESLAEALRQALSEYQLAGAAPASLQGLDGALVTSLPEMHESLVVWGASAYAALTRSIRRAESFQLGSEAAALEAWGEARLREFRALLNLVRAADLHGADTPPWGQWG